MMILRAFHSQSTYSTILQPFLYIQSQRTFFHNILLVIN